MASYYFGMIFLSSFDKRLIKKDVRWRRYLLAHEESHRKRWWMEFHPLIFCSYWGFNCDLLRKEELIVQGMAYKQLISEGYTLAELDRMSVDYRFLSKFGLSYDDYKKFCSEAIV